MNSNSALSEAPSPDALLSRMPTAVDPIQIDVDTDGAGIIVISTNDVDADTMDGYLSLSPVAARALAVQLNACANRAENESS